MPRPKKPARLYLRPDTDEWVIRDGSKMFGTGARGSSGERDAEQRLAEYLVSKAPEQKGPAQPSEIKIGDILTSYVRGKGAKAADRERLANAVLALSPFWADKTADAIKTSTCAAYARERAKPRPLYYHKGPKAGQPMNRMVSAGSATVRRELGVLQAAINAAHKDGMLIYPVAVTLTDHGTSPDRWLTRQDMRAVLRECMRGRSQHLARFLIVAYYTGTRPGTILRIRWTRSLTDPWVDLENGVLHRMGKGESVTNKRRGSCRIPKQLLRLLRRWSKDGGSHVVMFNGKPIKDIGKAIDGVCERVGVERFTPHTMKHTAVTRAFQNGVTMAEAVEFFSTSAGTLERVYREHSPEYQDNAVKAMEKR